MDVTSLTSAGREQAIFHNPPQRPTSWSCFFTADFETGYWWVPFNEAASWGPVRYLFLKLQTLMWVSQFSFILARASLLFSEGSSTHCCMRSSVSWQFLARNGLHFLRIRIDWLSEESCLFSSHFETLISPTNADAVDTQLA